MIRVLLDHSACVHHLDNYGSSALHYAGANARIESDKHLLEAGADPDAVNHEGMTPFIRLSRAGRFYLAGRWWNPSPADREKTAELLLDAGYDVDAKDNHGKTALHYAAANGRVGLLKAIGV